MGDTDNFDYLLDRKAVLGFMIAGMQGQHREITTDDLRLNLQVLKLSPLTDDDLETIESIKAFAFYCSRTFGQNRKFARKLRSSKPR